MGTSNRGRGPVAVSSPRTPPGTVQMLRASVGRSTGPETETSDHWTGYGRRGTVREACRRRSASPHSRSVIRPSIPSRQNRRNERLHTMDVSRRIWSSRGCGRRFAAGTFSALARFAAATPRWLLPVIADRSGHDRAIAARE